MDEKGFTLIELLATISILAMIMIVAVPNIMSTLDKSKRRTYVEDDKKMITLAEYRVRSDTSIELPTNESTAVAFTLASMDLTDFSDGPEGGQYDLNKSYVLLIKSSSKYLYYATLVEKYDSKYRGIDTMNDDDLLKDAAINNIKDFKDADLPTIPAVNNRKTIIGRSYIITKVINQKQSYN